MYRNLQPNLNYQKKKRLRFTKGDKIVAIALAVFSVVLMGVMLLERAGYRLIQTELPLMGSIIVMMAIAGWILSVVVRLFKGRTGRILSGAVAAMIVVMIGSVAATIIGSYSQIMYPQKFAELTSPGGKKVVVMRRMDTGFESEEAYSATMARMDTRKAWIESQEEQAEEQPAQDMVGYAAETSDYPVGAYGYVYYVYPTTWKFFYNENANVEGAVYRGYESEAKIFSEWIDENTVRLYLEDAEIGDEGEVVLKY